MGYAQFMDMYTGSTRKTCWDYIYVEAETEALAREIFEERFQDPDASACTCCGRDYSVSFNETLEDATWYERGCALDADDHALEIQDPERPYVEYTPLPEYLKKGNILVLKYDVSANAGSGI
jgi:hypothetical protein